MTKNALELINVSKNFDKICALDKINFELKSGEICALIGPSGSGKTTLLQIAGLLDNPNSGKIFINEFEASKASDATRTEIRKKNIGFIYQFHHLLPEFSALENVMMPLLIQGKSKDEAMQKSLEILKEIDLENRSSHKPSELSGGQQQRVAIARAIVSKPSLILADEPTGNLDSINSKNVFDMLKDLASEYKIACLLVTHNLDLAKKLPRQIEIKDGKIIK
jgi:lipoprotein-releasing system ATP-binding protein